MHDKIMHDNIIELKDVWKTYRMGNAEVHALCGLSLTIKRNDFVAVMGPSGSGKSTTLNAIGCLDVPTKGTILLDGKDISKMPESALARIRGKKIGFIFQQFNLIGTLSAAENVMLPMMFQGIPREKREKKAMMLLEKAGLKERSDHKPGELSGGEQQRVAIARALANDPEVLLADEPTGNLDSKTGETVIGLLREMHKAEKRTIVMVTHDAHIASYAHRIEYLRDGQIVKTDHRTTHRGD